MGVDLCVVISLFHIPHDANITKSTAAFTVGVTVIFAKTTTLLLHDRKKWRENGKDEFKRKFKLQSHYLLYWPFSTGKPVLYYPRGFCFLRLGLL